MSRHISPPVEGIDKNNLFTCFISKLLDMHCCNSRRLNIPLKFIITELQFLFINTAPYV